LPIDTKSIIYGFLTLILLLRIRALSNVLDL